MTPSVELFAQGPELPPEEQWIYKSLAEAIFGPAEGDPLILIGAASPMSQARRVRLSHLQKATLSAHAWMQERDITQGSLFFLPRLSLHDDIELAVALVALLGCGASVCLPMELTPPEVLKALDSAWILSAEPSDEDSRAAMLEMAQRYELDGVAIDGVAFDGVAFDGVAIDGIGLATFSSVLGKAPSEPDALKAQLLDRPARPDILLFSTSGSTGQTKWVRYHERAFLACAEAWSMAGLMKPELTGGPSLCPLLSHSMGVRNVLHALWNRRPTLLIPPHWFEEYPYRAVEALMAHPPAHVTGGPFIVQIFGEYLRRFPRLREAMDGELRCFVSSGTTFDPRIRQLVPGITMANGYGTTETQQVLSTLLDDGPLDTLGGVYPGVHIGLGEPDEAGRQMLYVHSPFGASGYRGEPDFGRWWCSQDQVRVEDGRLRYQGRVDADFLKTGYGIKVPRVPLERELQQAIQQRASLLIDTHPACEGLVLLAFVGDRDPMDAGLQEEIAQALAAHLDLQRGLDPFAERFVPLLSVGFVAGEPPMRSVGKVDRYALREDNAGLLAALADAKAHHPCKRSLAPSASSAMDPHRHIWPVLGRILDTLDLEWEYVRGQGDTLFALRDGQEIPVLDLAGGFGVNLLGHNDADIQKVALEALARVPLLDQLSARPASELLARQLAHQVSRRTGKRWVVSFASTGGEAVEMALEHAALSRHRWIEGSLEQLRVEFGAEARELVLECEAHNAAALEHRPPVFALERGFHGKTVGALAALGDAKQREPFRSLFAAPAVFLPPDGGAAAQRALAEAVAAHTIKLKRIVRDASGSPRIEEFQKLDVLCVLAEPIQGEGGIYELPMTWLQELSRLDAPLILDEIQSGLGRSGRFLASQGVVADAYLFGKALGGGVAKIAALLIERGQYIGDFDQLRGSTFAGDSFSCSVGSEVLRLLEARQIPQRAEAVGEKLKQRLLQVQQRFPQVLTGVRGRGLMLGVDVSYPMQPPSTIFSALADRGLGYLASSWLLHHHQIRVLPTLSAPDTLRIEPSYLLSDEAIAATGAALEALCEVLAASSLFELVSHLLPDIEDVQEKRSLARQFSQLSDGSGFQIFREAPAEGARRVAFVHNPVHASKLLMADAPPFALLSSTRRREVIDWFQQALELGPMPSFSKNLFGGKVWMKGITMAATPSTLLWLKERGELELIHRQLQQALEIARDLGCEIATYGAFTSVISRGATTLWAAEDIQVSSGNTFTTAVAAHQVLKAAEQLGLDLSAPKPLKIGVVGALGNIGQTLSALLFAHLGLHVELVLIGRRGSIPRLQKLQSRLQPLASPAVHIADDLEGLPTCDVILAATSTLEPIVEARHIAPDRPVVVADISQPAAVASGVSKARPLARIVQGGMVQLPEDPDFMMSAHTEPGAAFACASEALLMGLEPHRDLKLTGDLDVDNVRILFELGRKYGLLK